MHWNRFNMSVHKKGGLESKVERKKMQTEKERKQRKCEVVVSVGKNLLVVSRISVHVTVFDCFKT